jgi:hypothetical protein
MAKKKKFLKRKALKKVGKAALGVFYTAELVLQLLLLEL